MHLEFQPYFVTPNTYRPLSFHGTSDVGRWCDGELVDAAKKYSFAVVDTVPIFVIEEEMTWPGGYVEKYGITPDWLASKYHSLTCLPDWLPKVRKDFCRQMAASDGLIMEVAMGPDGGNMPFILLENPNATILGNELGYNVLKVWRAYQKQYGAAPNLSLACFDARHSPLQSDCIDIISSYGGYTEIGTLNTAFREAYRILKPGGRMYICESWYTLETVSQLPAKIQKKLGLPQPDLGKSVEEAGFTIVCLQEGGRRATRPDAGDTPKLAYEYGVTLETTLLGVEAIKKN